MFLCLARRDLLHHRIRGRGGGGRGRHGGRGGGRRHIAVGGGDIAVCSSVFHGRRGGGGRLALLGSAVGREGGFLRARHCSRRALQLSLLLGFTSPLCGPCGGKEGVLGFGVGGRLMSDGEGGGGVFFGAGRGRRGGGLDGCAWWENCLRKFVSSAKIFLFWGGSKKFNSEPAGAQMPQSRE